MTMEQFLTTDTIHELSWLLVIAVGLAIFAGWFISWSNRSDEEWSRQHPDQEDEFSNLND